MLAFAVFSFNCYIFFWPITSWHCGIKSGKRCQCKAFCETDSAESRRMQDKFFLSAYSWNAFHISLIKHNVWNESHYSKKSLQTLCYISRSKLIRLTPATSIAGVPLGNSRILILCDVKNSLVLKKRCRSVSDLSKIYWVDYIRFQAICPVDQRYDIQDVSTQFIESWKVECVEIAEPRLIPEYFDNCRPSKYFWTVFG